MKRQRPNTKRPKKKTRSMPQVNPVVRPPLPDASIDPYLGLPVDPYLGLPLDLLSPTDLALLGDQWYGDDEFWDEEGEYDEEGYFHPVERPLEVQQDRYRKAEELETFYSLVHGIWSEEFRDYGYRGYRGQWYGSASSLGFGPDPDPAVFVRQATEWADRVEPECKSAQFWTPYMGFSGMSQAQLNWYFHWRGQVRTGTYPRSPGGYATLLAYEVLNGIGVESPEKGLDILVGLDRSYSKQHKLGYQFDAWIDDYAAVHGISDRIPEIRRARGLGEKTAPFSNLAMDARAAEPMGKMPLPMIGQIGQAFVELGSFSQAGNEKLLSDLLPKAVGEVDAELRRQHGKGLVARYAPGAKRTRRRWAYEGALVAGKRRRVDITLPTDYATAAKLASVVKGILEHAENRIRTATGFVHLLPTEGVNPVYGAIVDAVIERELPEVTRRHKGKKGYDSLSTPTVIAVDPDRVAKLQTDSAAVRGMLIEGMVRDEDRDEDLDDDPVASWNDAAKLDSDDDSGEGLTGPEQDALIALLIGTNVDAELRTIAEAAGMLPGVLVDGINEAAIKRFGEGVVDTSAATPTIHDEYREELAAWLAP